MSTAYFKNNVTESPNDTFTGELTNSNGNREIDFDSQTIKTENGTIVTDLTECREFGCVDYSPGNSGKADDLKLLVSVNVTGTISDNDTKVAIRNLAKKLADSTDDITVTISRKK